MVFESLYIYEIDSLVSKIRKEIDYLNLLLPLQVLKDEGPEDQVAYDGGEKAHVRKHKG